MSDELAELFNLEVDEFNKKPKVCLSPNLPPSYSLSAHSHLVCGRWQTVSMGGYNLIRSFINDSDDAKLMATIC